MKKTHLILTRHGKTAWNLERKIQGITDTPLHSQGKKETLEFARSLKNPSINRIYSSHLTRAKQTVEIINEVLKIPYVHEHPKLYERSFGPYEGVSWQEIDERFFSKGIDFFKEKIAGVEERNEFIKRVVESIDEIGNKHKGETILVVTHGGCISSVLSSFAPDLKVESIPNNCYFLLEHETKVISHI